MKEGKNHSFEEKKSTLSTRIDIHKQFSKLEINDWILEMLKLHQGENVLDVGCGTGKQIIPYKKVVGEKGLVVGSDISEELISEAKKKAKLENLEIQFIMHDSNNPFDFPNSSFDVISCCFAIYYVSDLEKIVLEFKRLLKPGGRLFLAGPTPLNAKLLHELHQKITNQSLPYMPGVSRFMSEVLSLVQKHFQNVQTKIFQNPITFQDIDSFLKYYISTGLYLESSNDDAERNKFKDKMKQEVINIIQEQGKIEIMKEVGGILAYK